MSNFSEHTNRINSQVEEIRKFLMGNPSLASDQGTRDLRKFTYSALKWASSDNLDQLTSEEVENASHFWDRSLKTLKSAAEEPSKTRRTTLLAHATRYAELALLETGVRFQDSTHTSNYLASEPSDSSQDTMSLEGRLSLLDSHIDQLEERVKESSSSALRESEVIRAAVQKRLTAFEQNLQTKMAASQEAAMSDFNESVNKFKSEGEAALDEIKNLRDDTKTISEISAGKFVSENYNNSSKAEFKTSVASYFAGVLILFLTLLYLTRPVNVNISEGNQWAYIINRVTVTAIALTATTVAFKLGSNFLDSSQRHKRLSMDVSAMGPFLAQISDQTLRDAARSSFSERTFSPNKVDSSKTGDAETKSSDVESQTNLIQSLISLIQASRPEK